MKAFTLAAALVFAHATLANAQPSGEESAAEKPAPTDEQIQQWITQLGDEDFQTREAAQASLVAAGNPAYFALDALPATDDPEMKLRVRQAKQVLEDDAAAQLREFGASVLKRDHAEYWNYVATKSADMGDAELVPLMRLRRVQVLRLDEGRFTDNALDYCRNLRNLRHFTSYRTQISDGGLETLTRFRDLESIGILLPNMTNKGMASIATLPNLRNLSIFNSPIDGRGLVHLRALKGQLEVLQLEGTAVGDEDLVHIRDFNMLRVLRLNGTAVTGKGLRHISGLPNLESLFMRDLDLSDEAFAHLSRMQTLQRLSLNDSTVTTDNLLTLLESRSVIRIYVSPAEFTENEVKSIQTRFDARDVDVKTSIHRY